MSEDAHTFDGVKTGCSECYRHKAEAMGSWAASQEWQRQLKDAHEEVRGLRNDLEKSETARRYLVTERDGLAKYNAKLQKRLAERPATEPPVPDTEDAHRCATCVFFGVGTCFLKPPIVIPYRCVDGTFTYTQTRPAVDDDATCGSWKGKR